MPARRPPYLRITSIASWPLYPILIAFIWVMATLMDSGIRLQSAVRPLVVVPLLAVLVLVVSIAVVRGRHRAGALAGVVVVLLISRDLSRLALGVVGAAAIALAIVLVQRIWRRQLRSERLTIAANAASTMLLLVIVAQGLVNGTVLAWGADLTARPPVVAPVDGDPPDIYLILLDGYPRADIVREALGGDNARFLDELGTRGFTVDPDAHSGYMYTDLAVSSMLHGQHLDNISGLDDVIDGTQLPARGRQVLNEAPLLDVFSRHGYTLIANAQAWDEPSVWRVHHLIEGSGLNEVERYLLLHSLPGVAWQSLEPSLPQDVMRPWVEDAFSFIPEAAALEVPGPKFVFAHVPSPHFPIVFTRDGGTADPDFAYDHPDQVPPSAQAGTREAYLEQVAYLNGRLLDLLDIGAIPPDAIVLIMSDHGPEFGLDWDDGGASDLTTRFASLFAARAPGGTFERGQAVTGVLVRLLNSVLDESLDEPDDRFFVSASSPKYATLTEVPNPWED